MSAANSSLEQLLVDATNPSAKKREAVAKALGQLGNSDPRVLSALWNLASSDPVPYVRLAAREALTALGRTPPSISAQELQEMQKAGGTNWALIIGAIVALACIIPFGVITILAIIGPQIGNIFSRVTNGLSGGTP